MLLLRRGRLRGLVENAEGNFLLATSETFADRHLRSSTPVRSGDLTVYTWSLDCLEADCDMIEFDPPESACRADLHLEDGETLRLSVKDPMVSCEVLHRVTN